jgi:hypothetical protein
MLCSWVEEMDDRRVSVETKGLGFVNLSLLSGSTLNNELCH